MLIQPNRKKPPRSSWTWCSRWAALNVKVQELRIQMRATFKHMTLLDLERAFAKRAVGTDVAGTEANRAVGTDVTGATTDGSVVPTAADRTQFFLDGVHPTATTYDLLGKYAAPILKKWARR